TVIPSKIFEAMAMGVPVLMSLPEGEATAIIRDCGCGVCVPPESPNALADAILALASDPGRMALLRAAAVAAAPRYSRDVQARKMEAVLLATRQNAAKR
ncbi:glycosyl transferase group 1, partial [mine drainage metagenome]